MQTYIKNVSTLEELKAIYKKLALKHHPDCGGDEEVMKAINNEYDELFEQLKDTHMNKEGEYYTKETDEHSDYWKEIISQLLALHMNDVLIEVIGSFLWISGNTKSYKEQLKGLGLRWSAKKMAWYLSPPGYKRFGKKHYEMDEIRGMYGSQRVKQEEERRQKAITQK